MNLNSDPFPYASHTPGYSGEVALIDGRRVNTDDVVFDERSYRFTWRGQDVTNQIRQTDKITNWRSFDRAKDNLRASDEKYFRETGRQQAPTGSTSTAGLFMTQVFTEPFKAPIEAAQRGTEAIGGFKGMAAIGGLLLVGLIVYNVTKK